MKITEGVILKVEHDLLDRLCLTDYPKDEMALMTMYVAGVNTMAQAVIEVMKEGMPNG